MSKFSLLYPCRKWTAGGSTIKYANATPARNNAGAASITGNATFRSFSFSAGITKA